MFGLQLSTSGSNIILICWYIMEATRARYRSILRVGSSSNWHSFDVVNITTFIIFSFVLVRRLHCCNDETIYIYPFFKVNGLNSLKRISCPYMADRSHILE